MREVHAAQQLIPTSTNLAGALTVRSTTLVRTLRITKALSNSNHLQPIVLRPVNQPRGKRVNRTGISLVHERNVAVATGARLLKHLLALLGRLAIPVTGVDVVGDDAVAEGLHRGEHVATGGEVRRAHVGGLYADDVDEGLLEARHLRRQVVGGEGTEVRGVRPGVGRDLVAGLVRVLEGALLVVDAACSC